MNRLHLTIGLFSVLLAGIPAVWGCRQDTRANMPVSTYRLPDAHEDNDHPMKEEFFRESFTDLSGKTVRLVGYRGSPLVIMMFPMFRTDEGRASLIALEKLVQVRQGQFVAMVIPFEDADTIRPVIRSDPGGMSFLYLDGGSDNLQLMDRYSDLFWDETIIAADFPHDLPSRHRACPFYWIVDRSGTIREKLIDYSLETGVRPVDLALVLDALLGPWIEDPDEVDETGADEEIAEPDSVGVEDPE